jgi:NAD(P)-dependent dehydrogenase (short-subunit alcohol dehydrogenase family)
MPEQNGKSAIVTGAAKRVGREIALALAKRRYNIGLHFNSSQSDADATKADIEKLGVKCALLKCDLNDQQATAKLVGNAVTQLPGVSVLINNASMFEGKPLLSTTVDDLERNFAVHVRAPFILTQEFARQCREGNVINIVDMMVVKNNVDYFAYSLSKKSLFNFTQLAAKALAPSIRVNAIAPGSTMHPVDESDLEYMTKRAEQVPLKMQGGPQYVIAGIEYLLDNPFVTGECLFIDGGVHIDC